MKAIATLLAIACAFILEGHVSPARAVNTGGDCSGMTATNYIMSDVADSTNSPTFVNLTDGNLTFAMASAGCASITFTAMPNARSNQQGTEFQLPNMQVRVLLDGNLSCAPALQDNTFYRRNGDGRPSTSFTRVCKNLSAGSHTVQVQFRQYQADPAANLIPSLEWHVLTVTHN